MNLADLLNTYKKDNAGYVTLLFSSAYVFKQTFAIPGSVFLVSMTEHLIQKLYTWPFSHKLYCTKSSSRHPLMKHKVVVTDHVCSTRQGNVFHRRFSLQMRPREGGCRSKSHLTPLAWSRGHPSLLGLLGGGMVHLPTWSGKKVNHPLPSPPTHTPED